MQARAQANWLRALLSESTGRRIEVLDATGAQVARLTTEDVRADLFNIIPPQKAGRIAQPFISVNNQWVGVEFQTFEAARAPGVHVIGDAIAAEHEYGPRVSAAVDDTHDAMGDLQKATLEHVFAMRAILRPDQQARFDAVVSKSLATQPQ